MSAVNKPLIFLVIFSIIDFSIQDVINNEVESDAEKDESPLADVAKEILKEKNLENIGGMVSSFIQSGGAKQILDGVLQNLASNEQSGQLLESLGNILNSATQDTAKPSKKSKKSKKATKKSGGEVNPLSLLSGLGSLVGALQGAGKNNGNNGNPADLLQGLGSLLAGGNNEGEGNAAALLQGLGTLLGNSDSEKESRSAETGGGGGAALLQGLGSLFGAAAGNQEGGASLLQGLGTLLGGTKSQEDDGGSDAGALLQGLGSLLSGGQGGEGGINAEMIGNVISTFANSASDKNNEVPSKSKSKTVTSGPQKSKKVKKSNEDDAFDFDSLLNMASTFLNQDSGKGKAAGGSSLLTYLPTILNTINAFTGPEAQERATSHSDHSWALPPILERIHVLYDNFQHSEVGKQILTYVSTDSAFKPFRDESGNFSYEKFEELIENHSFRKHWIQQLAGKLVYLLKVISDEKMQKNTFSYIMNGIHFANSLLQTYGFPKRTWFDTKKPVESITNFANYVAKNYLDYDFDTREYVAPIVLYVQDVLKLAKETLRLGVEPKELTDKLTDTINLELIEPITRVNRAYRFAKYQPKCDKYVLCLINQHPSNDYESFPNLKKTLYKGSSLIAGWFVSSHTGTSYWDLYEVITVSKSCNKYHSDQCNGFHDEDSKVTTEYVHNEL